MTTTQEQNVPKLRFPEFSGEWEEKRLGKLFPKIRNGFVGTATPFYEKGGIAYLQGKNIKSGRIDPTGLVEITRAFHEKQKKSQLREKDILMVQSGHVGECAVVTKEYDNTNCHALIVMSPTKEVDSIFIRELFYAPTGLRQIYRIKTGNTVEHILTSDLKPLSVHAPLLPEQQKIASFLSSIDSKIEHLRKKKSLLVRYKKGMMQKLFRQEIRFKDDGGKVYPDWEEKRLGEIAEINPKSVKLPDEFLYIDLESVSQGRLTEAKRLMHSEAPSRAQRLLSANDILFQLVRPYQRNNFFFQESRLHVASTGYAQLRTKESSSFLYQAVHENRFVNHVLERCTGTNYPAINSNDLAQVPMKLPSIDEQEKIADFLSAIDRKINLVIAELEKAKTFKKGLLQQMFV